MFGLDTVVEKALEKSPPKRFQTAFEFADALREIVAHRTGDRSGSDRRSWVRASFRACSTCGNLNSPVARFCGECGEPLDRESITPTSIRKPDPPAATVRSQEPARVPEPSRHEEHVREEPRAKPGAGRARDEDGAQAGPRVDVVAPRRERASIAPPPAAAPRSPRETPPDADRRQDEDGLSTSALRGVEEAIRDAEASGDPSSALVFLEQLATTRLKIGDPVGAIAALRRGIDIARADLDKGELDDPIRVVAIFSAKLGEAYLETGDFGASTRALKDALALSRKGPERTRIWLSLSRVARAQNHDKEAAEYLEAADQETASSGRRSASDAPQAANESTGRRKKL